jgi:HPt (histidine-containing phosphotransfer) domain-containing protein
MSGEEDAKAQAERQLREQVVALGIKFLQRTLDQATSLDGLIGRLAQGDCSVLARIQELSHKIHGSGAMFGFAQVSRLAGEIEQLCYERRQAGDSADPTLDQNLAQRLNHGVADLVRATRDAQRSSQRETTI